MEQVRKSRRQLQAEEMHMTLRNIVASMAQEKPLDQIRIQDICSAANVTVGTFYIYFKSKEEALLYSYRFIDEEWSQMGLEKIENPIERLFAMLEAHLESISRESICFITQLYISQLKHYDEYFYSPQRFIHRTICQAVSEAVDKGIVADKYTPSEITDKLLKFARGEIYNYCLNRVEDGLKWKDDTLAAEKEYFSLFLK